MEINAIPNPITVPDSLAKSLRWPLDSVWKTITQNFKITSITGSVHSGIDIDTPLDPVPIYSAGTGKIVRIYDKGYSAPGLQSDGSFGGYGNSVDVDHGGGLITRYGHMTDIDVVLNQDVKAGQQIGTSGDTGVAEGTHLHFETRYNNIPVDPNVILGGTGNVIASEWDKFVTALKKTFTETQGNLPEMIKRVFELLGTIDTTKLPAEQSKLVLNLGTATSAIKENINAETTDKFLRAVNAIINFSGEIPIPDVIPDSVKAILDNVGTIGGTVIAFAIGALLIAVGVSGLLSTTPVAGVGNAIQSYGARKAVK